MRGRRTIIADNDLKLIISTDSISESSNEFL
jgi:hypothetical protein